MCLVFIWLLNSVHIHPSLAGVVTALLVPYKSGAQRIEKSGQLRDSVFHVLEQAGLNVPVNWLIVPGFIMLSVVIKPDNLAGDWITDQSMGVFFGFVLGKSLGVFLSGVLAMKLMKEMPANSYLELFFGSVICGMGLTVALFFAGLGADIEMTSVTMAILSASAICGVVGTLGLLFCNRHSNRDDFFDKVKN